MKKLIECVPNFSEGRDTEKINIILDHIKQVEQVTVLDVDPGKRYISRKRSVAANPIQDVFKQANKRFIELENKNPEKLKDTKWLKENLPFTGELFLGHLRYGTFGGNTIEQCHPFLRQSNWKTRNLVLAGNFNMTNVDELFQNFISEKNCQKFEFFC